MRTLKHWLARLLAVAVAVGFGAFALASPASANPSDCPYNYLCVYSNAGFTGYRATFYFCGTVDLQNRNWDYTNIPMYRALGLGRFAATGVSSLDNNQTPGTRSNFQDNYSSQYHDFLYETAPGWRQNLALDTDNLGGIGNWNDRIRWIHVC